MKKYIIEEVIEFECSNDGELTTQFRLEGDPDESYRQIVIDENYYYFAEDICKEEGIYLTKEWEEGDFEDEGHFYEHFDFKEWREYEHSEDTIKEFIYEYYEKNLLPEIDEQN
jgi:hypothetical protein|tara:strand:- start:651 stop:989 length:339 start_codon:yes stop_codon:yes gene_type:complete